MQIYPNEEIGVSHAIWIGICAVRFGRKAEKLKEYNELLVQSNRAISTARATFKSAIVRWLKTNGLSARRIRVSFNEYAWKAVTHEEAINLAALPELFDFVSLYGVSYNKWFPSADVEKFTTDNNGSIISYETEENHGAPILLAEFAAFVRDFLAEVQKDIRNYFEGQASIVLGDDRVIGLSSLPIGDRPDCHSE